MSELLASNMLIRGMTSRTQLKSVIHVITPWLADKIDEQIDDERIYRWFEARQTPGHQVRDATRDDPEDILDEEWPALTTPTDDDTTGVLRVRQANWSDNERVPEDLRKLISQVFLIDRLREVRAFRGFSRVSPEPDGTLLPPNLRTRRTPSWLPAVEVFGEGIFLQICNSAINEWETAQTTALQHRLTPVLSNLSRSPLAQARFGRAMTSLPRWMMLHSLSHLLMRQLCFEAGYGASAIRERLYVADDRAGVLIYTADGDSEGSLGGLVRQGECERLVDTIIACVERATWCSNDPVCSEMPPNGPGGMNLSACHSCSLAPETSCPHLNLLLDRALVVGDGIDGRVKGFMREVVE